MKASDIPSETFPIPFADSAGGGYIRQVPVASQIGITNGAASLTDGFPPLNFLPVGSGGVPPFGQDMNGVLNQITQWTRWQNAGALVIYDSGFSAAIGGYPKGAILSSTTAGNVWLCTVDDNTSNPDAAGAGWELLASARGVQKASWIYAVATGTANALIASLTPALGSYTAGTTIFVKVPGPNAAGGVSININGVGVATILMPDGSVPPAGSLNGIAILTYDGTNFRLENPFTANTVFATPPTGSGSVPIQTGATEGLFRVSVGGLYSSAGSATMSQDISPDGGATWTTMASDVAGSPGNTIQLVVSVIGTTVRIFTVGSNSTAVQAFTKTVTTPTNIFFRVSASTGNAIFSRFIVEKIG